MRIHLIILTLAVGILFGTRSQASSLPMNQSLPILSNLGFGWVSMSGIDPTLDMFTSFAPTMLCVHDAGYEAGVEHAQGVVTFGKFTVLGNFQSVIANCGDGALRISHYGYASNTAAIQGSQGVPVHMDGDSIDLSYAQRIGKTTLGVTVLPQDNSNIQMYTNGLTISGTSTTDYGVRLGGMQQLTKRVRFGLDYSYQKDSSSLQLPVPLVPSPTTLNSDYLIRCGTVGASWLVAPKTETYLAYQSTLAKGEDLDYTSDQLWCGVSQQLTKTLTVRADYFGGGKNCFITWRTKYGLINVAYTHNALFSARNYLGKGNSIFAGIDLAI